MPSPSVLTRAQAALAALALAAAMPALAQDYPSKPVTLVVPFAPGGTTDIIGRVVAEGLGRRLGQTVIVDNRAGAGGNIGAAAVAHTRSDGYTLLMGYNGTNAINPSLYRQPGFDPLRSFEPLSMVARVNNVVVVHPSLPVTTLPDLVAHAKANPGKVNYGSAGPGSIFHLAGEMLEQQTGVQMTHVPYRGASPALTDLIAGQVQVMFTTIPAALQHIRAGKLRAIGVTGPSRSPLFPDLPTARESGLSGMVVDSWFAIFAPQGLPADVRHRLTAALHDALIDPVLVKKLQEQGAQPTPSSPGELAQILAADLQSWKKVIQSARVTLD